MTKDYEHARTLIEQKHLVALISDLSLQDYDPYGDQGLKFLIDIEVDNRPPTVVVTGAGPEIICRASRDLKGIAILDKGDFAESKLVEAIMSAIGQS